MTNRAATTSMSATVEAIGEEIARARQHFQVTRAQMADVLNTEVHVDYVLINNMLIAQARHEIWTKVAELGQEQGGDLTAALHEVRAKTLRRVLTGQDVASGLANELARVRDQAGRDFLRNTERFLT
ncbi:hypothetical protein ETD86_45830 [Nonomuraea turkmeniaca]|uniref:DUF222 domain-containing protein n=1 Tax=Nonomuraea turkmeniaca TaxID=103838 RepID=A0A5S4EYU9_9ACTN|nr:hypothetical protein [Nonomuraea turkmeniaca]TMR08896.1 hypothetical protein ETD86_45830 [Nonomuraea turkmeniaca]